jgi:hypothetical protein
MEAATSKATTAATAAGAAAALVAVLVGGGEVVATGRGRQVERGRRISRSGAHGSRLCESKDKKRRKTGIGMGQEETTAARGERMQRD